MSYSMLNYITGLYTWIYGEDDTKLNTQCNVNTLHTIPKGSFLPNKINSEDLKLMYTKLKHVNTMKSKYSHVPTVNDIINIKKNLNPTVTKNPSTKFKPKHPVLSELLNEVPRYIP